MADMKAYLAEKYMSGPKADAILSKLGPKKKKKRKHGETAGAPIASSSMVVDDDGGWGAVNNNEDDVDDVAEAVVASDRGFKKRKTAPGKEETSWVTVKEGDANVKEEENEDDKPMVVDEEKPFVGGLLTAKQLRKVLPSNAPAPEATAEEIAMAQETIYRDATGRKIDTKAAKAEAARLKREREEKEAQKMEWGKGVVQRNDREKMKEEMEKLKTKTFARHVDDADLNEQQKQKELWNDPAAAFLTKKRTKGPRRPEYTGPTPPPNRFGIKPGYRWDGVDRGNGFEKKLFQTQNERKRKGLESYQWGAEDM